MKRFNTISCIPGLMSIVDYEEPVRERDRTSVVDKKYFIPLSEQRNQVFRSLSSQDRQRYSFPDGVDDGRDVSMHRRGMDLAEMSTNLSNVRSELNERVEECNNKVHSLKRSKARYDKYHKSASPDAKEAE